MMDLTKVQGTPEWKEYRMSKIGSSDAPVIMEVSPWKTPYKLWLQKTDQAPEDYINPAMLKGNEFEPIARKEFEAMVELNFYPIVLEDKEYPWRIASLDGMTSDSKCAVEIKCPNEYDHQMAKDGLVPMKYIPQVQHILSVADLPWMYYVSYRDGDLAVVKMQRDDEYIQMMLEMEKEFYEAVQSKTPLSHWPETKVKDASEDDEFEKLAREYMHCQYEIRVLEDQAEDAKRKLIEYTKGEEAKSRSYALRKVTKKGAIDYDKIFRDNGLRIDKDLYRKPHSVHYRISEI